MEEVNVLLHSGNFSKVNFGIFVTITMLDTEFRGDLGLNPEVKDPINKRAAFYDTLPLTDTHGHPVDEHSDDHHEDKEHQ